MMDRRSFVAASASLLAVGASRGSAADPAKGDSVKVVVEGPLGTIVRAEKTGDVTATVAAGGGEFVIDAGASKAAREGVLRLADKYIKGGSTSITPPRLKVTGRLEFRATQVVGENGKLADGPRQWVLVAESVAESAAGG